MIHKAKFHGTLKIIVIILLVIVIIAGLIIGFDYKTYKDGNRSYLFGTLNSYNQNQTLRFGDLDLKVSNVELKLYPKPTKPIQSDCSGLVDRMTIRGEQVETPTVAQYACEQELIKYPIVLSHYESKNELTIKFEYSNIADQPLNLTDFKIKAIANTSLDPYISPVTACSGMRQAVFLKGNTETECISMDVDKGYTGPLALSVTRDGKEKNIQLAIPVNAIK